MSRSYKFRARILAHEPIAGFPNSGVPVRSIELANIRELSSGRPVKNQVNRAGKIFKSAKPGDTVMFEATVGFPDIRDAGYRLEKRLLRPQNVRVPDEESFDKVCCLEPLTGVQAIVGIRVGVWHLAPSK